MQSKHCITNYTLVTLAISKSWNGKSGNGIRGMMGMRGTRVEMMGIRVGMIGMMVIRAGMWGIGVEMQGIGVRMRDMRLDMREIRTRIFVHEGVELMN